VRVASTSPHWRVSAVPGACKNPSKPANHALAGRWRGQADPAYRGATSLPTLLAILTSQVVHFTMKPNASLHCAKNKRIARHAPSPTTHVSGMAALASVLPTRGIGTAPGSSNQRNATYVFLKQRTCQILVNPKHASMAPG